MSDARLDALRERLRRFVAERDWARFHTPKNLAAALSVEAAELLEHFQWLQAGEAGELGPQRLREVGHELADVFSYLLLLADRLGIDPLAALAEKIELNDAKYPAAQVRGDAAKYTQYRGK